MKGSQAEVTFWGFFVLFFVLFILFIYFFSVFVFFNEFVLESFVLSQSPYICGFIFLFLYYSLFFGGGSMFTCPKSRRNLLCKSKRKSKHKDQWQGVINQDFFQTIVRFF